MLLLFARVSVNGAQRVVRHWEGLWREHAPQERVTVIWSPKGRILEFRSSTGEVSGGSVREWGGRGTCPPHPTPTICRECTPLLPPGVNLTWWLLKSVPLLDVFLYWGETSCGHSGRCLSLQLPLQPFANSRPSSSFYNRKSTPGLQSVCRADFAEFSGGDRQTIAPYGGSLLCLFMYPSPVLHGLPDLTIREPTIP